MGSADDRPPGTAHDLRVCKRLSQSERRLPGDRRWRAGWTCRVAPDRIVGIGSGGGPAMDSGQLQPDRSSLFPHPVARDGRRSADPGRVGSGKRHETSSRTRWQGIDPVLGPARCRDRRRRATRRPAARAHSADGARPLGRSPGTSRHSRGHARGEGPRILAGRTQRAPRRTGRARNLPAHAAYNAGKRSRGPAEYGAVVLFERSHRVVSRGHDRSRPVCRRSGRGRSGRAHLPRRTRRSAS